MPRPKEFDPEEVLDRAMRQFWTEGYECTTVQDLVEATGLSRSSLYETFGCKEELYLAALDRYREREVERIRAQLAAEGAPMERIRAVLAATAEGGEAGPGCFLIDATVERARHSEDAERRAAAGLRGLEQAFADAIDRARQAGEIPAGTDPAAAGRFLANAYRGLHVAATERPERSGDTSEKRSRERTPLHDVIDTTLAALRAGAAA